MINTWLPEVRMEDLTPSELMNSIELYGDKTDVSVVGSKPKLKIKVGETSFSIEPWGKNNLLPNESIALAQSNGDIMNLLETREDFLFGTGIQLFEKVADGEPIKLDNALIRQIFLDLGTQELAKKINSNIVNTNMAFVNASVDGGKISFDTLDPTLCRKVQIAENEVKSRGFIVCPDFKKAKFTKFIPAFDSLQPTKFKESIIELRIHQTGQHNYGYPKWWTAKIWIELANIIPNIVNDAMKTEGNLGHIIRVAQALVENVQNGMGINPETKEEYSFEEVKKILYSSFDNFLYGTGKQKRIMDICGLDNQGNMAKWIEFEPIKKSYSGDDYDKLYNLIIRAFTNSSGILGGLSGLSDGAMNSGGGTEIRISAEFQQFYRTPREREVVTTFANKYLLPDIRKAASISVDRNVFLAFENIILQTLDKNPTGSKKALI